MSLLSSCFKNLLKNHHKKNYHSNKFILYFYFYFFTRHVSIFLYLLFLFKSFDQHTKAKNER
jgi:hypothetical protein